MDIPVNAMVECIDGAGGHSIAVILNPSADKVTHLVVRELGIVGVEHLVPVELIEARTPQLIRLRCTRQELAEMESFISSEFFPTPLGLDAPLGAGEMLLPYISSELDVVMVGHEKIPPGEVAVHRWAHVQATDGVIGRVDEFLINPTTSRISHLVLREGHLWGQKDITIPVAYIDHIDQDVVYLKLSKRQIDALPAVPVRMRGG